MPKPRGVSGRGVWVAVIALRLVTTPASSSAHSPCWPVMPKNDTLSKARSPSVPLIASRAPRLSALSEHHRVIRDGARRSGRLAADLRESERLGDHDVPERAAEHQPAGNVAGHISLNVRPRPRRFHIAGAVPNGGSGRVPDSVGVSLSVMGRWCGARG